MCVKEIPTRTIAHRKNDNIVTIIIIDQDVMSRAKGQTSTFLFYFNITRVQ